MCSSLLGLGGTYVQQSFVCLSPIYSKAIQFVLSILHVLSTPRGPPARKSSHYLYMIPPQWPVCLSVWLSVCHFPRFLFQFTSLTPIWLWHQFTFTGNNSMEFTFTGTGCCNVSADVVHSSNLHLPVRVAATSLCRCCSGIHSLGTESGIHSIMYISIYDKPYILIYVKIVYIGTSARTRRKTL